ncbi:MAG: polymer-forming cytoskeletal protein [Nitrospinae bacterium]|nr:polymer-forming cytoskeletal protein [Nitrospinota bacterium]
MTTTTKSRVLKQSNGRKQVKPTERRTRSKGMSTSRRSKGELAAFFGEGVECIGTITNHGNVRVDGRFEGEIYTKGSLLVGAEGDIRANIRAARVISEGKINGHIVAKEQVQLLGKARVEGDLTTPQLFMSEEATLHTPWTLWMKKSKYLGRQLVPRIINVVGSNGVDQQHLLPKK